jgi:hypothetical protein
MRRLLWIGAAVSALLISAGVVIADHVNNAQTQQVMATFSAAPTSASRTNTCTASNGDVYHITDGVYTGTSASSDPRLNGTITIRTHSVIDYTKTIGFTTGSVELHSTNGGGNAQAALNAVNTQEGKLDGFLVGSVGGNDRGDRNSQDGGSGARLYANFSAAFNSNGTALTGELGQDAPVPPTNSAIIFSGACSSGNGDGGD